MKGKGSESLGETHTQPSGTLRLLAFGDFWVRGGIQEFKYTEMEAVGYMRQLKLVRPFCLKDNSP